MRSGQIPLTRFRADAASARIRTGPSFLERLGFLYEHEIRIAIVGELNMREMGPKQFFDEIGGSSYPSVHRHFQHLAEQGWLRRVRTARLPGRGRPEVLYRATELAVIDDETWAQIPVSIRDAFTVMALEETVGRLCTADTAGTLTRGDHVSRFDRLVVDEAGWVQVIDVLYALFQSLSQEQIDAKIRLEGSGSESSILVVKLAGFELASPRPDKVDQLQLPPMPAPTDGAPAWPQRIAKVFSDWRNLKIVCALNPEAMSPSQLFKRIGGVSVEGFDHRCKQLVALGWAVKVDERSGGTRRGATENFYRATVPVISAESVLAPIPQAARESEPWAAFEQFCQEALMAVQAGTFNARDDRHLTLSPLLLDERGRRQVIQGIEATWSQLVRIQQESGARLERGRTKGQDIGLLLTTFESPVIRRRT